MIPYLMVEEPGGRPAPAGIGIESSGDNARISLDRAGELLGVVRGLNPDRVRSGRALSAPEKLGDTHSLRRRFQGGLDGAANTPAPLDSPGLNNPITLRILTIRFVSQ